MEFGILFTSHPNPASEPYPHREVHARVTAEIQAADRLGYDTAWVAEHHFSNQYGIMPDVFTYLGYLAAKTSRIRLGTAVVTVLLYEPVRVVEIWPSSTSVGRPRHARPGVGLSALRVCRLRARVRGPPRPAGRGACPHPELLHTRRTTHQGSFFHATIAGSMKCSPSVSSSPTRSSWPRHGPLDRVCGAPRLRLDALHAALLRDARAAGRLLPGARAGSPPPLNQNPACGNVDVARWVYVAETDAAAKCDTEAGIVRHISHS